MRPVTDYYKSLQQLSISPELDFLRDAAEFAEFRTGEDRYSIPSSQLAARYNTWRMSNGLRDPIASKSFTMKMSSHGISQEKTSRSNNFVIDAQRMCAAIRAAAVKKYKENEKKK